VGIVGNKDHPISKGVVCIKGISQPKVLYNPDRLLYPMMRVGERGEGKWKRISWGQALDYISEKLHEIKQKYGPGSICVNSGIFVNFVSGYLLARSLGSPNVTSDFTMCEGAAAIAGGVTVGTLFTQSWTGDFENSNIY